MRNDSELDNPQDSELEEVCVNENKCPLIVEVSPISRLSMKFISVCQLRLKSGKYQVSLTSESHENYETFCSCALTWKRREGENQKLSYVCDSCLHSDQSPPVSTPKILLPLIAAFYQAWAGVNINRENYSDTSVLRNI